MKKSSIVTLSKALAATVIGATALQADILNVFQDSVDFGNLAVTTSTNSDTVLVNDLSTPASALDGDAIWHWDLDGSGRTTLRHRPNPDAIFPVTSGYQLSFDAYIDPVSTGSTLVRIGNDGASMAGIKGAGVSMKILADGSINTESADLVNGGFISQNVSAAAAGTPFNLSVIFNAATAGDLIVPVGAGQLTLAPQTWALFVDNALIATDLAGLNGTSTGDGTYLYNPASGVSDIWWLTGGASSETGTDFQFDNIIIRTGADIGVVPEPSAVALALSSLVMALVFFRRLRRR